MGFDLLRQELVWLLLLAPVVFLVGWVGLARSRAELRLWVGERSRSRFLPGLSPIRARLRLGLGALAILFLALAVLGPVRGYTYRAVSRKGLDLVLCLDTSRSMLAQDLRPSRLERAKREIVGLLEHLRGDRVALVAFSGDARDAAPLTRDRRTLEQLLSFVTPEDNQEGGTDLAAAIEHALLLFDGRSGAHEAVVLLTDGEDLEGQAAVQADEAVRRGIRLFIVGLGTEAGGKIPIVDAGGNSSFLRDQDGQEVVTKLERESLVALATRTGGDYLSAEESPTALEDLYRARITQMQGREIEGGERRVPYDRFQWPLALGVLCLVAELALRTSSGRVRSAPKGARLAAACLPVCAFLGQEPFSPPRSLANAVFHQRAGEPAAAEQAASAILAHADEFGLDELQRAKAHFALGVIRAGRVLDGAEDADGLRAAASEAFSAARALAGPGDLRLDATYDLGALELFHAEEVRATIPEISGQPVGGVAGAPGPSGIPGLPAGGPAGGTPPADPLEEARTLYGNARTWLLERLQLDWRDQDTRADLELIQRRLHELDEIEKQREEQKQDQQEEQDQQQGEDQEQQDKNEDSKDKDQKGKPEDQEQDPNQEPNQGSDSEQDQEQTPEEQEPKDDPETPASEPEEKPGEERPPEDAKPGEEGDESPSPQAAQPKESVLTREEVMQLLDKLGELEKRQKALAAALRAKRSSAKKRDW